MRLSPCVKLGRQAYSIESPRRCASCACARPRYDHFLDVHDVRRPRYLTSWSENWNAGYSALKDCIYNIYTDDFSRLLVFELGARTKQTDGQDP